MGRVSSIAAAAGLAMLLCGIGTAHAGDGAIAYDTATGKHGFSWNQDTQARADAAAMKSCGDACKIVLKLGAHRCGALATTKNGKGWTTAIRQSRDSAKLAALQDCQKRAKGECVVQGSDCNK